MPKTTINCPNCHQPIVADIKQLFDVNVEPTAKQQLLSGAFNVTQCPNCGYQGMIATPIVYHDPEKELLLSYVPSELGLPHDEQERIIGSMIKNVVNNLPQEKRKGYLFSPNTHLTIQGLVERVLEAEGITREMIEDQQRRLNLLQRLLSTQDKQSRKEIIDQESDLIDADFFQIFSRFMQGVVVSGEETEVKRFEDLQNELLELTEYGRKFKVQAEEIKSAVQSLQEAGKTGLTREKLLKLIIEAPNETHLGAIVSLARPAIDYSFFQLLSERIDRARDQGRQRLVNLREQLLDLTKQIDEQIETRVVASRQILEGILQAKDTREAVLQSLPSIDEFFLQSLHTEIEAARKAGDIERSSKLQDILNLIQQASTPPPEIALIEKLLESDSEEEQRSILEAHNQEITPDFLQTLSGLATEVQQSGGDSELSERLQSLHRLAMRISMKIDLGG
ncbi:MAG: hypothetical protein IBX69_01665 [Anaerolineales bacterium]|nr:hypothetical protein [Anaerolineales bacterium]